MMLSRKGYGALLQNGVQEALNKLGIRGARPCPWGSQTRKEIDKKPSDWKKTRQGKRRAVPKVVKTASVVKVAAFGGLVLSAFHTLAHLVIVARREGGLYFYLIDRASKRRLGDLAKVTQLMGQSWDWIPAPHWEL